jgi:hypothetical protein
MKHLFILTWLLPALSQSLPAQDSLSQRDIVRSARIGLLHGHKSIGYLYAMTDSILLLSAKNEPVRLFDTASKGRLRFAYKDMETVEIYKKGELWRSPLKGLLIGGAIGALIGFASGNDPKEHFFALTAGEKAMGLGALGGTVGIIAGFITGLATHKIFYIHGKKEGYDRMRKMTMLKLVL